MTLTFYNKRRRSIRVIQHDEFLCYAKKWEPYLDTPNEYRISMRYVLDEFRFDKRECSFIELSDSEFICRHFVRDTHITPLISYEPDRSKCPYIREAQVSTVPVLDWRRIFWSRERKGIREYLKLKL